MDGRIQIRVEGKRGCGRRKGSGIYLCADGLSIPCGMLPIRLEICPTCGGGFRFSRSPYFINGSALISKAKEDFKCVANKKVCGACPLSHDPGRVLLMWIGSDTGEGTGYPTPDVWLKEAEKMGISRRIKSIPHGFKLGETWVWVAHMKGFKHPDGTFSPAVFRAFMPSRIEYVVTKLDEDNTSKIDKVIAKGWTPVKVKKEFETESMFGEEIDLNLIRKEIAAVVYADGGVSVAAVKEQLRRANEIARHEADETKRTAMLTQLQFLESQLGT